MDYYRVSQGDGEYGLLLVMSGQAFVYAPDPGVWSRARDREDDMRNGFTGPEYEPLSRDEALELRQGALDLRVF